VQDRGTGGSESLHRGLVQPLRTLTPAEDEDDGAFRGKREELTGFLPASRTRPLGNRAPDDSVLGLAQPVDGIRQEDAAGERRREPVREAEMGVRLGEGGADAPQARCEHDRPGDEPAAAENDVRLLATENARGRRHGEGGGTERAQEIQAQPPREALHLEDLELEAGLPN
jgi:hypothetical protein